MGEYFNWINVDKKEYISPFDFGQGNKRHESVCRGNELLKALKTLLATDWKGCHVAFMGDQCNSRTDIAPGIFKPLNRQIKELGYDLGGLHDAICESYRDIAGLFKGTEKVVNEEIEIYLKSVKEQGEDAVPNYYGVDISAPYRGLHLRESRDYKYTVNYTKKVAYSFEKTKILYESGEECVYADPLPVLMGYGQSEEAGAWLGDVIGVADTLPDGIIVLDDIRLDW